MTQNIVQLRTGVPADHVQTRLPLGDRRGDKRLLHDLLSPLYFHAYERPLWYEGKTGTKYDNTKHKALVRMVDEKPVCLNVVQNTYKVIQNAELFAAIDAGLASGISEREIETASIRDKTSYNGAICFREYVFPEISFASPEGDKIAFRVVVQNGFGTGSIKLYAGAIDFFCTNGVVIGDYTSTYAKHTKGVSLLKFENAVRGAVDLFWKNKDLYADLKGKKVLADATVKIWMEHNFGDLLGDRLYHQYLVECQSRGRNLWAVYSALTYYSSHVNGNFGLRNTGNDHEASTMMKRENTIRNVVDGGKALLHLAA